MKIIFMGTPEFAVPSLKALLDHGYRIPAVITAPDKPSGRGQKLQYSAVKEFILGFNKNLSPEEFTDRNVQILQPEKLKNPEFLKEIELMKADLQIVVAFRMLPALVWNMPPLGTFNLHASLLPQYRGAAPINWAIINGEKKSGLTTFFLNEEIDAGELILQKEIEIGEEETFGEYHDRLKMEGAELVIKTVQFLDSGKVNHGKVPTASMANVITNSWSNSMPRSVAGNLNSAFKHAPKLDKTIGKINWNSEIETCYNLIRGLSPFPAAYTYLGGNILKIYQAHKTFLAHEQKPGTMETDGKNFIRYYATDGFLELIDVQLENKKRMLTPDVLRGLRLVPGFYPPQ